VLLATVLAACGGEAGGNAEVAASIGILDNAGMHDIDESVNTRKEIPATAQNTAQHMQTVLLVTDWPADLEQPAKKLAALFGSLAEALDTPQPDLAKAGPAVKAAHDAWHDFSHLVEYSLAKPAFAHAANGGHRLPVGNGWSRAAIVPH
jgi:hypothetical protein